MSIITNKTGVPDYLEALLRDANASHKKMGDWEISVTESSKSVTAIVLGRRYYDTIEVDCQDIADTGFGTKEHEAVEEYARKFGYITEQELKLIIPLDTEKYFVLYGKLDLYRKDDQILSDYKTCKETTYNKNASGIEDEWDKQTLTYNAMLDILLPDWYSGVKQRTIEAHLKDVSKVGNAKKCLPTEVLREIQFSIPSSEDKKQRLDEVSERFIEYLKYKNVPDEELPLCSDEYRWAEVKYKIYKGTKKKHNQTAEKGHANYVSYEAALEGFNKAGFSDDSYVIDKVGGEWTRCIYYCECRSVCPHYKKMMEERNG